MKNIKDTKAVRSLMEQGDMGLFGDPLTEADQAEFLKQSRKNDIDKDEKEKESD